MASNTLIRIVNDEVEEDFQLPERIGYNEIDNAPNSLKDIDPDAAASLEDVENDFLTLGDLAYLNSITSTQIDNNSITTPKIAAGAITAAKISVGSLSAINADLGTITAGSITGVTITGGTIRTASSGTRVEMNGSANELRIYNGSTLRAVGYQNGWSLYNSSGTSIADIFANSASLLIQGNQSTSNIYLSSGSSGVVAFLQNGTLKAIFSGASAYFAPYTNGGIDLGVSGANWRNVQHNGVHIYQGIDQPITYWGRVVSGSWDYDNTPGFSISSLGTGRFRITHSLGHSRYSAIAIPIRGSGSGAYSAKIEGYSSSRVDVSIFDDTGTSRDSDFMFALFEDPN